MATQPELTEISTSELEQVTGGARGRSQGFGGLFSFLEPLFKSGVFHIASRIGGSTMAKKMYGRHASRADEARAQRAMKKFLVAGNKLPKGVPNLFG